MKKQMLFEGFCWFHDLNWYANVRYLSSEDAGIMFALKIKRCNGPNNAKTFLVFCDLMEKIRNCFAYLYNSISVIAIICNAYVLCLAVGLVLGCTMDRLPMNTSASSSSRFNKHFSVARSCTDEQTELADCAHLHTKDWIHAYDAWLKWLVPNALSPQKNFAKCRPM